MSILGFSIVGNPKMTFIFILGYPNPRKGALRAFEGVALLDLENSLKMRALCKKSAL